MYYPGNLFKIEKKRVAVDLEKWKRIPCFPLALQQYSKKSSMNTQIPSISRLVKTVECSRISILIPTLTYTNAPNAKIMQKSLMFRVRGVPYCSNRQSRVCN